MNKFFDLHMHVNPDIIDRKYSPNSLGIELNNIHSGGVLKSHICNTVGIATCMREQGFQIYGSIVLNKYLGGVNIDVVKAAIKSRCNNEPFIIYFPTFSYNKWSKNIKRKLSSIFSNEISCEQISYHGKLKKDVVEIIKLSTYYNCPVATGHSSKNEVLLLCEEVEKQKGRLLLTHPCHPFIGFSAKEVQSLLVNPNIFAEITLLMLLNGKQNIDDFYKLLSSCSKNICISSDLGQVENRIISDGYTWFIEKVKKEAYWIKNIDDLLYNALWLNPIKFLGI